MILAVCGTKGGIGKTTLAIQVAVGLALKGRRVWLIDGDRQGSAIAAITNRSEACVTPTVAAAHYPEGRDLRAQVMAQRENFDEIVIDVGGRDSTALRAALILADVALVPFAPRSFDVWALDGVAELIEAARAQRDGLQALAVLNQADPGVLATDNQEAADAVAEVGALEYLPCQIRRRKALSSAAALGLHVSEAKQKDEKAIFEVRALLRKLYGEA